MTDEMTKVPFEGKASDKATLLLAAAQEMDLPADVVKVTDGAFVVPSEVANKAFGSDEKKPSQAKKSTSKTKAQE